MTMFNKTTQSFRFGDHDVTLETGEIARQATGAVICRMDDTVVLATVVCKKEAKPGQDFFPLTVDYIEKTYAAGRIPGGFFKREGRPSEKETLTSRLIDRPIRPLFPDGFFNEVQVIIHVLSADPAVDPDIPAMLGASAALAVSGIPFRGPIGACRVGYIDDKFVVNPTTEQLKTSRLDLVVAGTQRAVLMVESEADILPEKTMLDAVVFGHREMQVAINAINELVAKAGKPAWDWQPAPKNEALIARIVEIADKGLHEAYAIRSKQPRTEKLREVYALVEQTLAADAEAAGTEAPDANEVNGILFELEAHLVRSQILAGEPRIDGRDTRTVRPIEIRQGVLPRTHGSALFTRGETQALVTTTLGTKQDEQIIDGLCEEQHDRFMLHYNMPPFATGETGRVGSPKRREIGHGHLAWRALKPMVPLGEENPYAVRIVSDILESNGSSSMATVCAGTLALMDAGVKLKKPVSGIAMGLISDSQSGKWAVLSDILGDEDHLGDMDFKVTGTKDGITATQMDIKVDGLSYEVLAAALEQARKGRLHILDKITECIAEPREDYKPFVPRIVQITIPQDMIGAVIGPGGKVIQDIQKTTGTTITITEVDNKGIVDIFGQDKTALDGALNRIKAIVAIPEIGETYHGKIRSIVTFGAFVEIMPGKDALLHISEIDYKRFETMEETGLKEGDEIDVKLIGMDPKTNKLKLSRKVLLPKPEGYVERERRPRGERPERGERHERHGRPERKEE
mgnify:CR=1 FL=1